MWALGRCTKYAFCQILLFVTADLPLFQLTFTMASIRGSNLYGDSCYAEATHGGIKYRAQAYDQYEVCSHKDCLDLVQKAASEDGLVSHIPPSAWKKSGDRRGWSSFRYDTYATEGVWKGRVGPR